MNTSLDNPRNPTDADATHDRLVAAAAQLRGQLQEDAAQQDRERGLTDRTASALRDGGLLRLTVPKAFGGHEADVRTLLDVTAELGRGCTSTAWVTGILNTGNLHAALFPDKVRRMVWGSDPNAATISVLAPSVRAEQVDGGVRLTGRWGYSSGSQIAQWAMMGIPSSGGKGSGAGLALIPMDELSVEDTWHVMGMRATASNTVLAEDVFVPDDRILSQEQVLSGALADAYPEEPLYQSNVVGIKILSLLGAQLGAIRTAFEYVCDKASQRSVTTTSYAKQSDSVSFQSEIAQASHKIDVADLLLHRTAEVIDDHARAGTRIDLQLRSRNRLDGATASQLIKEAMDLLVSAHGAGSFADVNPLQRIFRDLNVASRHAGTGASVPRELHGKVLLDQDPYTVTSLL
ncbi:acyl-CoA dehydrogenase family protein [Pseudonocardia spinosispora]|uniref:acyl-CoA dehydrogenase family protein n=1 Tax=Pseudonocardia spinosispora TaxID=103441 RepID=UPI0003FDFF7A|nr:acyl-CoA dehydrogenase family protein [Pseudonocardia spinosispora]